MQIIVNGKLAAIKGGSSFDIIAENRLFSGADSFSLSILFPLRGCEENLKIFGHINRPEVKYGKIKFDCEIRDGDFIKFGQLTVNEISDSEVKAQFLEGRSLQNASKEFDGIYINELDIGSFFLYTPEYLSPEQAWDPGHEFHPVTLPWVTEDSGYPHNFAYYDDSGEFHWSAKTKDLTWQMFLIDIVSKICDAVGYKCDLSEWMEHPWMKNILVCNTLPAAWEIPQFARALPHWTVAEFFEKLELFMRAEIDIDHREKKISFRFSKSIVEEVPTVCLDKVVDEFKTDISDDNGKCEYLENRNFAYKERDSGLWKYECCDWFVKQMEEQGKVKEYNSLSDLFKALSPWLSESDKSGNNRGLDHPAGFIHLAKNVNQYFMLRNVDRKEDGKKADGSNAYIYKRVIQPLNEFGNRIMRSPKSGDNDDTEEIDFVPVRIDFTEQGYGLAMFLNPGSFSESESGYSAESATTDDLDEDEFTKTALMKTVEAGKLGDKSEYYSQIFVAYYDGDSYQDGKNYKGEYYPIQPCPRVSSFVQNDYRIQKFDFSFAIGQNAPGNWDTIYKIDESRKMTFKFIADSIPNPRAVFFIRGRRYICEKITATFTEDGMSQLLKGEFWPLNDD